MARRYIVLVLGTVVLGWAGQLRSAIACPFCAAVSQTFSEEMASMDAVVITRLVDPPAKSTTTSDPNGEVPKAKFKIEKVLKGDSLLGRTREIETIYFGEAQRGQAFLVMGVDPPNLMWSTPLQLSERGHQYVMQLPNLPEKGADRLAFFQEYLEDEDEMLARDAYDEFAKAPYVEVKQLKGRMKHDQLIEWIKSSDVPASRRRLYLTMLGVCGSQDDLTLLEEMLKSNDRKQKAGLDAMIACYLTLKGPEGMPLIEDLFLKDQDAEYADTYSAIMALRFHGTEGDIISKQRVLEGLRYMLDRPQLADLVIPDLAKWEDWSVMEKLVNLFKEADEKSSWVRVPVINYLRACPLPESKDYIKELEKIDPAAVKRAETFFPFAPDGTSGEKSSRVQQAPTNTVVAQDAVPAGSDRLMSAVVSEGGEVAAAQPTGQSVARQGPPTPAPAVLADQSLNPFLVLGVMIGAGTGLLFMMYSILRGARAPAST